MNVFQFLPNLVKGDAISNHTIQIMQILRQIGYDSEIYVQYHSSSVSGYCKHYKEFDKKKNTAKDIIIYHHSIGSEITDFVFTLKGKKVLVYHNITPHHFFYGYNESTYKLCKAGREHLGAYAGKVDLALGDSKYNVDELMEVGYKNTKVLPIIVDFKDFEDVKANSNIVDYYSNDGYKNFIFVGRVTPHKKQEDVIMVFNYYNKFINPKSRLFIIGSYEGMEKYYETLVDTVNELNIDNVYFTGKINFDELIAYYNIADIFLCMSEHEGFCVPLLECMYFNIPIVAYNIPAICETLGKSGIVVNEKKIDYIAELINLVFTDEILKDSLVKNQQIRLQDFNRDKLANVLQSYLKEVM